VYTGWADTYRIALAVLIALCPLLAFATSDAPGKSVKVRAEGRAPGTNLAARDAAVLDAKRNAVWLWLDMEFGETPGDEFKPLLEFLDVYVASSRSLGVRTESGHTVAELEVYLFEWPLRADTAALLFRLRPAAPRIAFLCIEEDGVANNRRFQENTRVAPLVAEAFRSKGIVVVDSTATQGAYTERELISIAGSGDAALARYGVEVGADAVVLVQARLNADKSGVGRDSLRAQAAVDVRVVSTVDGRLFYDTRSTAEIDCTTPESGYDFALPDALYRMRDQAIAGAILAAHRAAGAHVRLTIEGVGDFLLAERYAQLVRLAEGTSGVKVVSVRGGVALLHFSYTGRMATLVDFLRAGTPDLPRLDVSRVVGTDMHLRAIP